MLSSVTGTQVEFAAIQVLANLRNALKAAADLYAFTSGLTATQLADIPAADADAVFSAVADANALAELYNTGLPPSTYPQPPSAYIYGSSQRAIVGPQ